MEKPVWNRNPHNPIVQPGLYDWRMASTFNPGVFYDEGEHRFYLYERAAGGLRPFHCSIGLLTSSNGIHFAHHSEKPVFTPEMAGNVHGSVQDPRIVAIDGIYYMTYAFRPFAWSSYPTGVGVPESRESEFSGVVRAKPVADTKGSANVQGGLADNNTRSGIAISTDKIHWKHHVWVTPSDIDDRNAVLFPEKINGKFALLRRPLHFVGAEYGTEHPAIWICYSDDLKTWSKPELVAKSEFAWEDNRIGSAAPPIRTDAGWLLLYHGVENVSSSIRRVCYRVGAMLLDLENPAKVLARAPDFVMEPEEYYERVGLYIPNVIFPTGAVVRGNILHLYYGVCDTAIALATTPLDALVNYIIATGRLS